MHHNVLTGQKRKTHTAFQILIQVIFSPISTSRRSIPPTCAVTTLLLQPTEPLHNKVYANHHIQCSATPVLPSTPKLASSALARGREDAKMGQSQPQHDFQSTVSQSSGNHPFVQSEASTSPAKRGLAVALRACTECRKKRAKVRRTGIAVRVQC